MGDAVTPCRPLIYGAARASKTAEYCVFRPLMYHDKNRTMRHSHFRDSSQVCVLCNAFARWRWLSFGCRFTILVEVRRQCGMHEYVKYDCFNRQLHISNNSCRSSDADCWGASSRHCTQCRCWVNSVLIYAHRAVLSVSTITSLCIVHTLEL